MTVFKFILVLMISIPSPVDGARHTRELILHGPMAHKRCVKIKQFYNRVMSTEEFRRLRCRRIRVKGPDNG